MPTESVELTEKYPSSSEASTARKEDVVSTGSSATGFNVAMMAIAAFTGLATLAGIIVVIVVLTAAEEEASGEDNPGLRELGPMEYGNFSRIWDFVFTAEGNVLYTEKCKGLSVIIRETNERVFLFGVGNALLPAPDLYCVGQSGTHGVVLDPNFGVAGAEGEKDVYVFMTSRDTASCHVVRLTLGNTWKDPPIRRSDIVDDISLKAVGNAIGGAGAHAGGRLRFGLPGTADAESLYITTGDNHNDTLPQSPTRIGGKVLRILRDGSPHPDNSPPAGFDPRIFTYGHRNPQGICVRPGTGQMYTSEHGPNHSDEVTPLVNGGNAGWDPKNRPGLSCPGGYCGYAGQSDTMPMTDTTRFPDAIPPVWNNGGRSQGMGPCMFVSGTSTPWEGVLLVGVMGAGRIDALEVDAAGSALTTTPPVSLPVPVDRYRALVVEGTHLYAATDYGFIRYFDLAAGALAGGPAATEE